MEIINYRNNRFNNNFVKDNENIIVENNFKNDLIKIIKKKKIISNNSIIEKKDYNFEEIKVKKINKEINEEIKVIDSIEKVKYKNSEFINSLETRYSDKIFIDLLRKYKDSVFSDKLLFTNKINFTLKTVTKPRKILKYYYNDKQKKILDIEIKDMLENGIITESNIDNPWSTPSLITIKKDGGYRMCVNYKDINDGTVLEEMKDFKGIENTVGKIKKSLFFTKIDLLKGFWQIPIIDDNTKKITSFSIYNNKVYEYNVMPMGLKNSPYYFNELMRKLIGKKENCCYYMDDILLFNNTYEEHIENIRDLLDIFKESRLVINLNKSKFFTNKVNFLGFEINNDFMCPSLDKIDYFRNLNLKFFNLKEIDTFLNKIGHMRSFINNYYYYYKEIKNFTELGILPINNIDLLNTLEKLNNLYINSKLYFKDSDKIYLKYGFKNNYFHGGYYDINDKPLLYKSIMNLRNKSEGLYKFIIKGIDFFSIEEKDIIKIEL